MSWSVNFVGKPENISKALEENSGKLSGVSKEEYDTALPHIVALVNQNFNKDYPPILKIDANGHAYKDGDTTNYSNCSVSITVLGGQLV